MEQPANRDTAQRDTQPSVQEDDLPPVLVEWAPLIVPVSAGIVVLGIFTIFAQIL